MKIYRLVYVLCIYFKFIFELFLVYWKIQILYVFYLLRVDEGGGDRYILLKDEYEICESIFIYCFKCII